MRNYMIRIIAKEGFMPNYYNPSTNHVILADRVARFVGCQAAQMLRGFLSVNDTWSVRDPLDAVGTVKETMP